MKKITKLLAVVLSLLMVACVFAGCNKKDGSSAASDEDAVKKVVNDFADARFGKFDSIDDMEDALEYCTEDGKMYEKLEDAMSEYESMIKDFPGDKSVIEEFLLTFLNEINNSAEIEIDAIEIEGDSATVETTRVIKDAEEAWETALAVYNEYYETEDTNDIFEYITENLEQYIEDAETLEEEQTVTLEKVDGQWLIVKIK